MTNERRYDESEVHAIFERAATKEPHGLPAARREDGMTLAELQDIGVQVGLDPARVARAAAALDASGQLMPRGTSWGMPVSVGRVVELERGIDVTIRLRGQAAFTAEDRRNHLIFLLEESELSAVSGPYPRRGGESNRHINGINMRIQEPRLLQQMLKFNENDIARHKGLRPGRYTIRAYPDALEFAPRTFELSEQRASVEVEWGPR